MVAYGKRQRAGRIYLWILIGLVSLFIVFTGYRLFFSTRFVINPVPYSELQAALLDRAPVAPTLAGEWPQWRGPNRDGLSTEKDILTEWPKEGPKQLWKARSSVGYSSFAVANGKVYTLLQDGKNEAVVCWDGSTGKELWHFSYPGKFEEQFGSGPRSTPTVDGDFIYAVGATGLLHCLRASGDGKIESVWEHDLLKEYNAENLQWGVSFSPLIVDDLVLTMPGGPNGNSLVAFKKGDPKDGGGKEVWKALDDKAGYSSPIVTNAAGVRQVLFFTASALVSVSPKDGKLLWRYPWETSYDCNVATPIVLDDYVFISSGYGKGCALLKIKTKGEELEAEQVYESNKMCNHFSSCVLYKEHLYGFHDPGRLVCMNFRTGEVKWDQRGYNKGTLTITADGYLIILGENGKLALARATPDAFTRIAECQLLNPNKCWTVPVLADGKLYVRDEERILCLEMKR